MSANSGLKVRKTYGRATPRGCPAALVARRDPAAFVAGLAMGMDKPLILLQEGERPVPLDYRDLVRVFYSLDQINGHIADFSTEVMARLQAQAPAVVAEPQTFLERLNL